MVDRGPRGQARQTDKQRTRRSSQTDDDSLGDDFTYDDDGRQILNRDEGVIAELLARIKALEDRA